MATAAVSPKVTGSLTNKNIDYTDELKKLKELLDAGIITEEEFTIKKRQLLNI